MIITIRNKSFTVIPIDPREDNIISIANRDNSTHSFDFKTRKLVVKDPYYIHNKTDNSYTYIDTYLEEFIILCRGYGLSMADITYTDESKPIYDKNVNFDWGCDFTPKKEQKGFIDGMIDDNEDVVLVEAPTGYGKTYMSSKAIYDIGNMRVMIYIRPTYISKWIKDLKMYFNVSDDDIYVIKGMESIKELSESGKRYQFVLASTKTMSSWFTFYNIAASYTGVKPYEFLSKLGIGLMLSDESHQHFNSLYKAVISLNPTKFIGLSATLITKDKYLERMHLNLFPVSTRLALSVLPRHLNVLYVEYMTAYIGNKEAQGHMGYNHIKYESSVLRNRATANAYGDMICHYINKFYIEGKQSGDKCLVYAKSLDMISFLTEYLKKKYKELDVRMYIGGSDYDDVLDADIRVSHNDKAGAAIDIPGLTSTINTISIDSPAAIVQMAGRQREIPGRELTFVHLYNTKVKKQIVYKQSNIKFLSPRVKSISNTKYRSLI